MSPSPSPASSSNPARIGMTGRLGSARAAQATASARASRPIRNRIAASPRRNILFSGIVTRGSDKRTIPDGGRGAHRKYGDNDLADCETGCGQAAETHLDQGSGAGAGSGAAHGAYRYLSWSADRAGEHVEVGRGAGAAGRGQDRVRDGAGERVGRGAKEFLEHPKIGGPAAAAAHTEPGVPLDHRMGGPGRAGD